MSERVFQSAIARYIWESRYRYRPPVGDGDASPADTWRRVAHALSGIEQHGRAAWENRFRRLLD
jgi:ribonucleoside-diphosphate reductase alpha chain